MGKVIDLTGQKFGRLTVIERAPDKIYSTGRKAIAWRCVCDCGNEVIVTRSELINKKRKNVSCGCWKRENAMIQLNKIHNGELKSYKKYNKYDLSGEYGIGYVDFSDSEGRNYFYFDLEDYEKIKNYSWHFSRDYVEAWDYLSEQAHKTIKLHRLVMNCTDNLQVDHIFHKKYDNRKSQLKIVTNQKNGWNKSINRDVSAGKYIGVYKHYGKYQAFIGYNRQRIFLGTFDTFEEAVTARKEAELKYYGEYGYVYKEQRKRQTGAAV